VELREKYFRSFTCDRPEADDSLRAAGNYNPQSDRCAALVPVEDSLELFDLVRIRSHGAQSYLYAITVMPRRIGQSMDVLSEHLGSFLVSFPYS
jgi:hypothetical protein